MTKLAEPIREKIIAALADKLSNIAALGNAPAHRSNSELDYDALPAVSVWDGSDTIIEQDVRYGQVVVSTEVGVETVHIARVEHERWSEQANAILAELIRAATGGDRTLGGLADDVAYKATTLYYPEPGSDIIGVDLMLEVRWRHDVGDPYTNSMG